MICFTVYLCERFSLFLLWSEFVSVQKTHWGGVAHAGATHACICVCDGWIANQVAMFKNVGFPHVQFK